MKRSRHYYKRGVNGKVRGLADAQHLRRRVLVGSTLGPANKGRRLSDAERQAIEQRMRDEGRL